MTHHQHSHGQMTTQRGHNRANNHYGAPECSGIEVGRFTASQYTNDRDSTTCPGRHHRKLKPVLENEGKQVKGG
jgi:hypothetical protein